MELLYLHILRFVETMLKKLSYFALLLFVVSACSSGQEDLDNKEAIGGVKYGGEFRFMSKEKIATFLPVQATDVHTNRVVSQLFETILKMDENGEKVVANLAESFKVSADGKKYALKIRKGVYFHDDDCFGGEGREMTADDVKFTLDMACSGLKINESSHVLMNLVKGAEDFYKQTKTTLKEGGVSGIKVLDKNTIEIELVSAYSGFDKVLTFAGLAIFPKEAYDEYGADIVNHPVGTGAFKLAETDQTHVLLLRNDRYWKKDEFGNQLPYLASIRVTYGKDKKSELVAFRKGEIDLVLNIPVDEVENVLGSLQEAQDGKTIKHKVNALQSNSVSFIGLNHEFEPFKDVNVRRAINLAIDRNEIVNKNMMGEGYPVEHGFIPPTESYSFEKVKGAKYNVEIAKALLAQAGFSNGAGFPTIQLYVSGANGTKQVLMAQGVAKQLKENLNINVVLKRVEMADRSAAVAAGKAPMWMTGWVADYPDPANFLVLFYGKNAGKKSAFINPFAYRNAAFDAAFENANKETNETKRMNYFVACDQFIVDDAVVIPLLNDDFITMTNARARNFSTNSLESIDFSCIFIKELK
jgi:oligopeptide transport system substrate-binding protein